MLSHQACLGFLELSKLMETVGDTDYAAYLKEQYEILKAAINEKAWDGSWYVRALTKDGRIGSRDSEKNPSGKSGAEPYVFTNCYATYPKYYGKSYQSWTTGTSAWALRCMAEGILGVQRDYAGLLLVPCMPEEWDSAEITRYFRRAWHHIVICNPDHRDCGTPVIAVDSMQLNGNRIPDFHDRKTHEVSVILR